MKISDKLMKQYRENLDYLIQIKRTIGNINNRIHSSAIQLAELYLIDKFPEVESWESKEGSESGIDIVGKKDGKPFVIGELKTTYPYGQTDFGAQQKNTIKKDLQRLEDAYVPHKYFFIINKESFDILHKKYQDSFPSVKIVNILEPEVEFKTPEKFGEKSLRDKELQPFESTAKDWDIEVKLTAGPLNGGFFNISTKYHHLIEEGNIDIINDEGGLMHCNTVQSMGKGRVTKNLKPWFKMKKFKPDDKFFLKKIGHQKFKVVGIQKY